MTPNRGRSWPSPSPTRRPTRCAGGWPSWSAAGPSACGCPPSTRPACGSSGPTGTASATRARSPSTTTPTPGGSIEIVCRELDIDTKKLSPRSILGQISQAKSAQQGPGRVPGRRRHHLRPAGRRRLRPVPTADAGGQRHGLRRSVAQHRAAVQRAPRRPRALPDPLHPHPDRRVPGHQRASRTPWPSCWPAVTATSWWSGTATSRSTGSGGRTSPTSSISSRHSPMPPPSPSTRTSAPPRPSSTPPTRSSPTTCPASRSRCGPTRARGSRSSGTGPRTSTTRRRGWPTR